MTPSLPLGSPQESDYVVSFSLKAPKFSAVISCGCRGLHFRRRAATSLVEIAKRAIENPMRAEIERLVEEIKQSVGLLRRHL